MRVEQMPAMGRTRLWAVGISLPKPDVSERGFSSIANLPPVRRMCAFSPRVARLENR